LQDHGFRPGSPVGGSGSAWFDRKASGLKPYKRLRGCAVFMDALELIAELWLSSGSPVEVGIGVA
jgi:hypothetical protein